MDGYRPDIWMTKDGHIVPWFSALLAAALNPCLLISFPLLVQLGKHSTTELNPSPAPHLLILQSPKPHTWQHHFLKDTCLSDVDTGQTLWTAELLGHPKDG